MKNRVVVHLLVAVALALLAGVLAIRFLSAPKVAKPVQVEEKKKVGVVVAAKALKKGAHLDAGSVRIKPYEPENAPAHAIMDAKETEGRVLSRDVSQDDPITPDKMYPKGVTGGTLEKLIEPGLRALTVKGNKVLGAGGLITPGSRVDVLVTGGAPSEEAGGGGTGEVKRAKLILTDIPVLATGTEIETRIGKDGREELSSVDTYTLMVDQPQAERLALASDHGTLHFGLRRAGDTVDRETKGLSVADLFSGVTPSAEAAGAPKAEAGDEDAVEYIRGVKQCKGAPGKMPDCDKVQTSPAADGDETKKPIYLLANPQSSGDGGGNLGERLKDQLRQGRQ